MDRHRDPARTHVSFLPSVLPSFQASVYHHRKPIIRSKRKKKKLQNICWNIEFFPQTFVFHIDNIRRIKPKQKKHRRAKSEHRNIPANFVINYDACAHPGNQYCEDEKHFTFLKRFEAQFLGVFRMTFRFGISRTRKGDAILEILQKYWEKHVNLCEVFSPRSDNQDYVCRTRLREILKNKESTELLPWITL